MTMIRFMWCGICLLSLGSELFAAERVWFVSHGITCHGTTEGPAFGDSDDIVFEWYLKDSNQNTQVWGEQRQMDWEFDKGTKRPKENLVELTGMINAGPGHATDFMVVMVERDAKPHPGLSQLKKWLYTRPVERGATGNVHMSSKQQGELKVDWGKVAEAAGKSIFDAIENNLDEIIGVAFVRVVNDGGKLKASWVPLDFAKQTAPQNGNSASFRFENDGGIYDVSFDIEVQP